MSMNQPSPPGRVERALNHLGIGRVHVAACMSGDWGELLLNCPDRVRSLTIIAPHLNKGLPDCLNTFPSPALIITGDQGASAPRARDLAGRFLQGELFELQNYATPMWADTVADRTTEVTEAIISFLARVEDDDNGPSSEMADSNGEIAGIRYRVLGKGPPLLLLPLSMAPSQWEPLVSRLSNYYSIILLGGPFLGAISLLEARACSGYGQLVAQVIDQANLRPGETVLEVGCGSGALARGLAQRTNSKNLIVATDLNPYLLSEAEILASRDGLSETISFERADAEALPYPDARFHVSISCTVMEEGKADQMLSELARVTRPGGRVVVMTRALDVDWWANLPLSTELSRRINALGPGTGAGVGDGGCADASLYRRLLAAGLMPLFMGPQFAIYREGERLADVLDRLLAPLSNIEAEDCRDAIRQAKQDGTLLVAEPFHCAVGKNCPK